MKKEEVVKYSDSAMFEAYPMKSKRPRAYLLWATPDPLGALAAVQRIFRGQPTYDLSEISDDERLHQWKEANSTHLKAPFEFVKLHFLLEGVSRAFTHQMVRQRTAVYGQESLRFAVKHNLADETPVPPMVQNAGSEALKLWVDGLKSAQDYYNALIAAGVPAEDARGLMPHATTTRLHYCTDLRALLDHAGNRLCTQAQFEWRFAFSSIIDAIRNHAPLYIEGDVSKSARWQFETIAATAGFKPVCYRLGHCPFGANIDRPCTIRDRVQDGRFNAIETREWLLDPMAARSEEERHA